MTSRPSEPRPQRTPPDRLAQIEKEQRSLRTELGRLRRDLKSVSDRLTAWQALDKLIQVAPELLALQGHVKAIAQLAPVAPELLAIAKDGASERAFRDEFQARYGLDPDQPGLWAFRAVLAFSRSKALRTLAIAGISGVLTGLATAWATSTYHPFGH